MDPSVLAMTPAASPPPGVIPDFSSADNLHAIFTAALILCIVVSTLVVALRMVARTVVIKAVDWTDYFALLGWIFSMAFMGCALGIDSKRRGRHMWDTPLMDYLQTTELENIASIMYCIGVAFSKISILLLFMKIFVPHRQVVVYWTNLLLIVTNAMFYVGGMVALIFQCSPRAKISNPKLPGTCTNVYLSFLLSGVWNVLSDFFILVFPIWAIWQLQMPLKRKFGTAIVFATGVFALLASIMRLYATTQTEHSRDIVWIITQVALWTAAEMCTVLLCGSFPFLPKFKQSRPSVQQLNGGSSPNGNNAYRHESSGTISVEHEAIVEVSPGSSPSLVPSWKHTEKRADVYSPV